ncbi:MAG: lipoate--protein ligase family protein [Cytophagales bacterium]|nr:lipoate--protein ligase family protein [Cytophagales bacterium]
MAIRLIDAGVVPSIRSQTLYHGLGYTFSNETPNTIVLAVPKNPYMCIGFFQDAEQELDITYCKKNNLPIIRRETGGGAVYLDQNQLFVQWIFKPEDLPAKIDDRFKLFVKPIVDTYKHFGVNAYYYPINDVHVDGKKIVGTGAGGIGEAEIVTGNFIFDFDYEIMANAINVPGRKFQKGFKEGLRNYMTTVRYEIHENINIDIIKHIYVSKCEKLLEERIEKGKLKRHELKKIEELDERMLTDKWLYQIKKPYSPDRMVKIHARVWVGEINHTSEEADIKIEVKLLDGRIEELELTGNFKEEPEFDLESLSTTMKGAELKEIEKRVEGFFENSDNTCTGISQKEWMKAFLKIKELRMSIS